MVGSLPGAVQVVAPSVAITDVSPPTLPAAGGAAVTFSGTGFAAGMSDELERIAPKESARTRARDKKIRGPKVVSVNPGLKKLAEHLAEKRKRKKTKTR